MLFANANLGVLHPFIHLGYGLEFNQPALVAQALAMTVTHTSKFHKYFAESEELAKVKASAGEDGKLMGDVIENDLKALSQYDPTNIDELNGGEVVSGGLRNLPHELSGIAAQVFVGRTSKEQKFAEMLDTSGQSSACLLACYHHSPGVTDTLLT